MEIKFGDQKGAFIMLKPEVIQRLADEIDLAGKNVTPIAPFTQAYPELTIEDAREIQLINIRRRMAAGAKMVGKKVGATNPVMQEKFNLREPVLGYLLSDIIRDPSQPIRRDTQIAPFIECEILFVLAERLQGPNVHPVDVLRAAKGAMPAIEVPDVRFTGSRTIVDAMCDNVFNGYLVTGEMMADVRGIDFANIPIRLWKNGTLASEGKSSAALGNPLRVVAWLANKLAEYGECLEAGDIVITGSQNPTVYIDAGDHFKADFGPLGKITADFI